MQAAPPLPDEPSTSKPRGGLTAVSDKESQQIIQKHISLFDLVSKYSALRSAGSGKYIGNCPLPGHDDSTPSFNVDEGKQVYHCFGCKGGGNATSFVQAMENIPRAQATEKLLNSLGYTRQPRRPEDKPLDLMERLAWTYHRNLWSTSGTSAMKYATEGRQLSDAILRTFQVGFAKGNELPRIPVESQSGSRNLRVGSDAELDARAGLYSQRGSSLFFDRLMFPLRNQTGDVVGFAGRALPLPEGREGSGGPKYLNGKESHWFKKDELLFGMYESASTIRTLGSALVVEGQLDVISLHQAGVTNTVAAMGSALSSHNLRVLWGMAPEVVLVMDGDAAGVKTAKAAVMKALPLMRDGNQLRIVMLPEQLDPDEFVRTYGVDKLRTIVANAPQLSEFLLSETRKRHPILTAEGQAAFLSDIDTLAMQMKNAPLLAQALRIQARARATMYALTSGLRAGLADCAVTPEVAITHPSARTSQEMMRDVLIPLLTSSGVLPQSGDPLEMNRRCLRSMGQLALKLDAAWDMASKPAAARADEPQVMAAQRTGATTGPPERPVEQAPIRQRTLQATPAREQQPAPSRAAVKTQSAARPTAPASAPCQVAPPTPPQAEPVRRTQSLDPRLRSAQAPLARRALPSEAPPGNSLHEPTRQPASPHGRDAPRNSAKPG